MFISLHYARTFMFSFMMWMGFVFVVPHFSNPIPIGSVPFVVWLGRATYLANASVWFAYSVVAFRAVFERIRGRSRMGIADPFFMDANVEKTEDYLWFAIQYGLTGLPFLFGLIYSFI